MGRRSTIAYQHNLSRIFYIRKMCLKNVKKCCSYPIQQGTFTGTHTFLQYGSVYSYWWLYSLLVRPHCITVQPNHNITLMEHRWSQSVLCCFFFFLFFFPAVDQIKNRPKQISLRLSILIGSPTSCAPRNTKRSKAQRTNTRAKGETHDPHHKGVKMSTYQATAKKEEKSPQQMDKNKIPSDESPPPPNPPHTQPLASYYTAGRCIMGLCQLTEPKIFCSAFGHWLVFSVGNFVISNNTRGETTTQTEDEVIQYFSMGREFFFLTSEGASRWE